MRWSLKIAKLAQIDVYIHFTFFILLTWVAFIQWKQSESIGTTFLGVVFILAIFACVVLHELGHALTARKYGIKTKDIILLPIGGVARLKRADSRTVGGFSRTGGKRRYCCSACSLPLDDQYPYTG